MALTRDPEVAALIDDVMSMAPPPPELPNVDARHRGRRRRALVVAGVVIAGSVVAVLFATPWSDGPRKPSVVSPGTQPTSPTQPPETPLLVPGPDATIERVDINDTLPPGPQEVTYVQEYSAGASESGPHLEVMTVDSSATGQVQTLESLGCNPSGNPALASDHQHGGQIISLGDRQACLITKVVGSLSLSWIDTDGVSVNLRSAGLSVDDLETIGRGVQRSTGATAVQVPLVDGLEKVAEGEISDGRSTHIAFHQGTCTYDLVVGAENPSLFGFGAPVDINGAPGRLSEDHLAWRPANGSTAEILGQSPDNIAATAATQCDVVGVARQVVQTDAATWQRTLDALGDRVHRSSDQPTPTTSPPPALPPAGRQQPSDVSVARAAVIATMQETNTSTVPVDTRLTYIEDGEALKAVLDEANSRNTALISTMTVEVEGVVFTDATHAVVTYRLNIGGTSQPTKLADVVLDGNTWKLSRQTACESLEAAGFSCPPKP